MPLYDTNNELKLLVFNDQFCVRILGSLSLRSPILISKKSQKRFHISFIDFQRSPSPHVLVQGRNFFLSFLGMSKETNREKMQEFAVNKRTACAALSPFCRNYVFRRSRSRTVYIRHFFISFSLVFAWPRAKCTGKCVPKCRRTR